jgi:nucleoside-diphosphate-sugar epimerase
VKTLLTGSNGSLGKKYRQMFPEAVPVSIRYGDSKMMVNLSDQIRTADTLIHASACLSPQDIESAIRDNTMLPLEILDMAGKINPMTHIILISTMSLLDESGQPRKMKDMTFYAASKYIMEELVPKIAKNPVTIVRFSSLFYEDPERDGLSKIIFTACRDNRIVASDCRRDFLPLWAACTWLNKLCCNQKWYNRTINLASGRSVNMIDIAHYLVKKYGVSFHHTALPDYSGICYKFNAEEAQSLEYIQFDLYKLIDQFYDKIRKELDVETARY